VRILAIHHVQVAMSRGGEDEARAFYAGLLGLDEVPKPDALASRGGVWFERGEVRIHLGVEELDPPTRAHPALLVDDLAAFGARLRAAGFAPTHDDLLPGFDRFYVQDPFGNRVELLQARR
jgi:catechol 2,3-dioxygenase-like lactoylglutathione lyase family enzyme